MDVFWSILPIALLIYWMVKPAPLPSSIALPMVAGITYLIKIVYFSSEPNELQATVLYGALSSLIPLSIVAGAIFLFKTMEQSGAMDVIRAWLNGFSRNRVAQLMVIGFAFSFMIEGASGFGTPAALAAPLLISLGLPPMRVAVFCLMMNSFPVSFGAVGTPTWYGFGALLEGLSGDALRTFLAEIGYKSALMHLAASLVIPVLGLVMVLGWKEVRPNLGFVYACILSCMLPYVGLSFLSYEFPAILGGMVGLSVSIFLAKKEIGLTKQSLENESLPANPRNSRPLFKALFPLWGTVLVLLLTRIPQFGIKALLTNQEGGWMIPLGNLGKLQLTSALVLKLQNIFGTDISWDFQLLYVPFILPFLLVSLLTCLLYRMSWLEIHSVIKDTRSRLARPFWALLGSLIFVRLIMSGGETATTTILGNALSAAVGENWQIFASYLGALGSFFSGSATVSNLTFGSIQLAIAQQTGISSTTILAMQSVGGAMGNMVCIGNIVAICSIIGITREGEILRKNILPMFTYGIIATLFAYLFF